MQLRGAPISQTALTTHVVPQLKRWGVKNARKIGYYVDHRLRKTIMRAVRVADARQTTTASPANMGHR
jgi:hypothetical protein